MNKSEIYHPVITYNDIKDNLQKTIDYKRKMLEIMIRHYLAGENMEISIDTLAEWRELIYLERVELESLVRRLEKLG